MGASAHRPKRDMAPAPPSLTGAPGSGSWPAAIFGAIDDRQFDRLRQSPLAPPEGLAEEMRELAIEWYGALFMTDPARFSRSLGHFPSRRRPGWFLLQLTQSAPGHRQPFRYVVALPDEAYAAYGHSPFAAARRGLFRFAASFAAHPSRGECPAATPDPPAPTDPLPQPPPTEDEIARARGALDLVVQGESVAFTGQAPQDERDRLFEILFWLLPSELRQRCALSTFSFSRRVHIDQRAPLIACYCDNRSTESLFPVLVAGPTCAAAEDRIRRQRRRIVAEPTGERLGAGENGVDGWIFGDADGDVSDHDDGRAHGGGDGSDGVAAATIAPVIPTGGLAQARNAPGENMRAGDPVVARLETVEQAMRKIPVLQSDVADLQECVARLSAAYQANGGGRDSGLSAMDAHGQDAGDSDADGPEEDGPAGQRTRRRRAQALAVVAGAAFVAGLATDQALAAMGVSVGELARTCWLWLTGLAGR